MKDDVPNLKDYSSRLREEANMDLADIKVDEEISEPTKKNSNNSNLWERWNWEVIHASKSFSHDG
jgi:hypothetical protein